MFRILLSLFLSVCAAPVIADDLFASYEDYASFVDAKMKNREFSNAIKGLSSKTQIVPQEVEKVHNQLREVIPYYLTNADVVKRVELENGYWQEMRAYWNGKGSIIYVYAFLHERDDGLAVLHIALNTNSEVIFGMF
ncbi:hypothetical protein [Ruegeria atlantica]|uniref:hypothetical protein n=1 Tax=Ruegeria atlantica TaxID=81569 RepID=UPI001479E049|nr:hypothetical protein [Ruegeria atlantica]